MYTDLEIKYLEAKEAYYLGQEIMSDASFDALEQQLKKLNSTVIDIVGYVVKDKKKKIQHLTPMLSLEKLQVNDEDNIPLSDLDKWLNKASGDVELTPKYDGNAISLIYDNGYLKSGITRGDGVYGLDKTDKLKHLVPNKISDTRLIEIRGEVVISLEVYNKKYYDPNKVSNPRNFVAGLLNRDDLKLENLQDLTFVAYSITSTKEGNIDYIDNTMQTLSNYGFNQNFEIFIRTFNKSQEFPNLYKEFKDYRKNISPFLLDGIVLKFKENLRSSLGANNHHVEWALAIKFETLFVNTTINDIEWTVGTTGELSPIAMLEPVELLGTIVKKASLYNLGTILKRKLFPGATVSIRKSGEIIPQVMELIQPSEKESEYLKAYENIKLELTENN